MIIDAVVPARGASKRLPGKNLRPFGDAPLVVHSIRFAVQHPAVRGVYVSTDSAEIAAVASAHGARVIDRPADLSDDHSTTSSVLEHALRSSDRIAGADAIATLQPTSPLRRPEWLTQCIDLLDDDGFDSAITVSAVTSKVGVVDGAEFSPLYTPETRSQDLADRFRENGLLYVSRVGAILAGSLFGRRIGAVIVDHPYASVDIDTEADLVNARLLLGVEP